MRTDQFDHKGNEQLLSANLDSIKERREVATIKLAHYHHKLRQQGHQSKNICSRKPSLKEGCWKYEEPILGKTRSHLGGTISCHVSGKVEAYRLED